MILVDANLLVYAHVASFPQHDRVRTWLDERLNGVTAVGMPWPSLLSFLRLVTNPRIFERPESIMEAWKQVEEWLNCSPVWIPQPTERHDEILGSLLTGLRISANLIPDAHLAALAIEHGLLLCSTDGDFGRFPGLKWENPIGSF
ncbi:MAG: type II toxin-antitoxin system VapC family toxin [Deltaproteobacteria bacterium]|nr:type II toxin-antitoxin system VapC family toxin [Deltaproteobacteria bacterium]MBW2072160.1 type II toxin-antitoxin system VapC family toxin [Deltaproteobacteria bacterium]